MNYVKTKHAETNEIAKYMFLEELEIEKDPKTVRQYINAIREFEVATGFRDFREYNSDWAKEFKHHLNKKKNQRTGENISQSLYVHYLAHVRVFFEWILRNEKGYSKIKARDVAFLKPLQNESNQAKAKSFQESHDIADLLSTIRKMPEITVIEKRNKAMFSLALLTSVRIGSLQTTRISSIRYLKDYDAWALLQDPKTQKTKTRQSITSFFIGQSQDIIDNVLNWLEFLKSGDFADNDYLFPRTKQSFTKDGKSISILDKGQIKSTTQIREALKEAFVSNNLKYISPHKFRHSIVRKLRKAGASIDMMIALGENLGHKTGMATLVASYAGDYLSVQAEMMQAIELE